MMTGGCTINGKHFVETHAWGAVRYTRRTFIDGKMVSRAVWLAAKAEAQKAQAAGAGSIPVPARGSSGEERC